MLSEVFLADPILEFLKLMLHKKIEINEQQLSLLGKLCSSYKLKLIISESMTAGFLSSTFAMACNSGEYFLGGIVNYDAQLKQSVMKVPKTLIDEHTAESAIVTSRLLDGLVELVPYADVFVSVTGLAFRSDNPQQSREVGTVYFAFQYLGQQQQFTRHFQGTSAEIIIQTCNAIYASLYQWLKEEMKL